MEIINLTILECKFTPKIYYIQITNYNKSNHIGMSIHMLNDGLDIENK